MLFVGITKREIKDKIKVSLNWVINKCLMLYDNALRKKFNQEKTVIKVK